jgi:hydroxymethylglutaryl-CoA reductase (NADPH)
MSTLADVRKRFASGEVKQQNLETVIFTEVYKSDANKVKDACRDAAVLRCEGIEKATGASLPLVKASQIDNIAYAHGSILPGIEMKVGAALIPMGIAGPIRINGEHAKGEYFIPLATNEAALVAGVQRGIKAINMAGGLSTLVTFDGMARAPMIEAPDIGAAHKLCRRVVEDAALVKELGSCIKDPFVRLEYIEPYQLGTKVFLRFVCKTGDAMGMNGVTKASADMVRALLAKLPGWRLVTISGNLCTDKKAAHINVLKGRGKSVHTEIHISEEVLKAVFKQGVTARKVQQVVFHKCYLGSGFAGTVNGFNVNAANTIAAFFAATGQDLAQVITSASVWIQADATDDGLHFMASLPSLELATIGGGANYGTAREMLAMMGCAGGGKSVDDNGNVLRLAEICAAAVTALDLNTACAQAAGYEMADSHVAFARGEKE